MSYRAVSAALVLATASVGLGCHRRPARPPVEEILLERKRIGLERLIAAAKEGRFTPFDQVLIVVQQELVQRLIEASLPFERDIESRYRIRVESARVTFEDGFALVQLGGRASLVGDNSTFADIDVYGGLDVVELDPKTGILRGDVTILAVDTRRVDVRGFDAPARRLVSDLGRERLETFAPLLSKLEIPVSLESQVEIPEVNESGVHIDKTVVPMAAMVADVKAYHGRLWVCAKAEIGPKAAAAMAARPTP